MLELTPLSPFRLDFSVWTLRRRAHNLVDRWDGTTYRRVLCLATGPAEVEVTQLAPGHTARLRVAVTGQPVTAAVRAEVTASLERLLGLRIDMSEFNRFAERDRRLKPLANRFRGMKPPRFATVFESAVNAIACQQVSLSLGIHLLNRVTAAYGAPAPAMSGSGDTARAFPRPTDLAKLPPEELRQFGFSRQKSRAIIELAQLIADGQLDFESYDGLADVEAMNRILELRGLGRWSAEYILLRGLGRTHIFPGDDVGARKNLQRWLKLSKPLDYDGVRRVLSRWNAYGGLVYFHLLLDRLSDAGAFNPAASATHEASGTFQE